MAKDWITQLYPIGAAVSVPKPQTNQPQTAVITGHTHDRRGRVDGVLVRFGDGAETAVDWITLNVMAMQEVSA